MAAATAMFSLMVLLPTRGLAEGATDKSTTSSATAATPKASEPGKTPKAHKARGAKHNPKPYENFVGFDKMF